MPYYRPGDPAVADAIKGLAGKYSSVLLANHGPVVSGDTLEAAVFAIEELEETAKLYLLLRGLNPRYLSPEQVEDLTKTFGLTLPEHGHDYPSSWPGLSRPSTSLQPRRRRGGIRATRRQSPEPIESRKVDPGSAVQRSRCTASGTQLTIPDTPSAHPD